MHIIKVTVFSPFHVQFIMILHIIISHTYHCKYQLEDSFVTYIILFNIASLNNLTGHKNHILFQGTRFSNIQVYNASNCSPTYLEKKKIFNKFPYIYIYIPLAKFTPIINTIISFQNNINLLLLCINY